MKSIKSTLAISTAALMLASSGAFAISKLEAFPAIDTSLYGARVININSATRWINVDRGETVKLVNQSTGKSMLLTFDGNDPKVLNLQNAAPDVVDHRISAYVAEQPRVE